MRTEASDQNTDMNSGSQQDTGLPKTLERQINTPRTRAVKNLVMNANKGLKNPMANDIGRTAREYTKEKQIEALHQNKVQPKHEYLYAQIRNGVNVRLARPHQVTIGRLNNHVFKQSLFDDDSSDSDEKSPVDVHGNRERNQKAFMSYVKDAKAKREINQMKAYISKLQNHLQNLNTEEITQKERKEPQSTGMKRADINAAAMNKQ